MNVFYSLQKRKSIDRKHTVLTVGNFDGIHLGHQALVKQIVQDSKALSQHPAIITFVNHPAQVIRPHKCPLKISTNQHRIELFRSLGVEDLYMLEFSTELSGQTTLHFIEHLSESLHISKILMGHDAAIGKNREGDFPHMQMLGAKLQFAVEEFPAVKIDDKIISSTLVREAITQGNFPFVTKLLGRPYSIYGNVISGSGQGAKLGFPTANVDVTGLCLPPQGVYGVTVKIYDHVFQGIANLGIAPTLKNSAKVTLEVHLFDNHQDLYNVPIEVVFDKYIRPEQTFSSLEALKEQIRKDIESLKASSNS